MKNFITLLTSLVLTTMLTACSDSRTTASNSNLQPAGTYNGLTTPAEIDETNAADLAVTTTDATISAIAQSTTTLPSGIVLASELSISTEELVVNQSMLGVFRLLQTNLDTLPADGQFTSNELNLQVGLNFFCDGSLSYSISTANDFSMNLSFNQLCITDSTTAVQTTINGSISFTINSTDETLVQYNNLTVDDGNSSLSFDMDILCSTTCTFVTDYVAQDTLTYRLTNLNLEDDGTGTYSISATIYHPYHGSVPFEGVNITFGCANSIRPKTGIINFTGSNGVMGTITFTDCGSYDVSWDDTTIPVAVPSGSTTGSWLD